jgi:hypothetical protein
MFFNKQVGSWKQLPGFIVNSYLHTQFNISWGKKINKNRLPEPSHERQKGKPKKLKDVQPARTKERREIVLLVWGSYFIYSPSNVTHMQIVRFNIFTWTMTSQNEGNRSLLMSPTFMNEFDNSWFHCGIACLATGLLLSWQGGPSWVQRKSWDSKSLSFVLMELTTFCTATNLAWSNLLVSYFRRISLGIY